MMSVEEGQRARLNILLVEDDPAHAELIIRSARHRKESRGLHYNLQYPQSDDERWRKDTVLRRPFVG